MKAWVCRDFATPFKLEIDDVVAPVPGPGEVRIRVHAAGLAYGETLVLEGRYQKTPPLPYIPSSEVAGVVDSIGEGVTRVRVGDRVAAFSIELAGGGLAEFCVMPERFVHLLPDAISLTTGAGLLMNAWTAFNALYRRGALQSDETILVHGATGGVGGAAIAVARAIGARVIATGSDDCKVADLGVEASINHRTGDLRERVLALTEGRGVDVVFDPVGGDLFDASMRVVAPGGRILVVGFTSGRAAEARTNVVLVKMISIIGVEARLAIERTGGAGERDFQEMLRWIADGRIAVADATVLPFEQAADGYRRIVAREHSGKLVVAAPSSSAAL